MSDDVIIRIRTAFEKGGIAAAEAELLKLAAAGAKASLGTQSFASQINSLGQGLRGSGLNAQLFSQNLSSVSSKISSVGSETKKAKTALDEFKSGLGAGIGQGLAGFFAVQGVIRFTESLKDAVVQFQRTKSVFEFSTGSVKDAAAAYEFARVEANRLGLEVGSLAESYAKFIAGAKGSSLSAQELRTTFLGVSEASSALGLSSQQVFNAFRALTQIISKGKVTREEFTGQLAEAIPGSLAIAARALGVTTTEFTRLLNNGELTLDLIPKLGQAFRDEFGGTAAKASSSLSSEITKLGNAWTQLQLTFGERGGTATAIAGLGALREAANQASAGVGITSATFTAFTKLLSGEVFGAFKRAGGLLDILAAKFGDLSARRAEFNKIVGRDTGNAVPGSAGIQAPFRNPDFGGPNVAAENKKQEAIDSVSASLAEQAKAADIAREAIRIGGQEGERYAIVQGEIARQTAANLPVNQEFLNSVNALASSKVALSAAQKGESEAQKAAKKEATEAAREAKRQAKAVEEVSTALAEQTGATNLQIEALSISGAAGARFLTIQTEINKAISAGVPVTAAIRAEAEKYADSQSRLAALEFSQSIKEQTESISAQAEAFKISSESSIQYAALQEEITNQLQRGIPVTDEQRQAIVSLGQEDERYAIIQSKIAEAIANRIELSAGLIQQIRDQADAQVKLNGRQEVDQLTARAADDAAREFERQSDAITQTLTDAIFRGFENGKGFAENFKDTVKNLFSTLVLRPVIEFLVKPVAQLAQNVIGGLLNAGVSAIFSGAAGMLGASQAADFIGPPRPGTSVGSLGTDALRTAFSSLVTSTETATAAINQLGFQAGLTGGPSGQAGLLGSQSASSLLGTLGGGLAIAGLSYGLGSLIGPHTGSALQGAFAGGAAGGVAGGAIAGTGIFPGIGTAIGAIIGAILGAAGGGLSYQTPPRGFATFNGTGVEALGGKKGLDANKSLVPLGKEIQDSIAAIDKDLSLGLIKDRIKFWIGFKAGEGKGFRTTVDGKDVDFGDDSRKLQAEILRQEIKDATDPKKKRTEFQKRVLARGLAKETFPEQLASFDKDLKVRNRLREFTKQVEFDPAKERIKELRGELRKLTETFGSLKKEATELGLPTKRAAAAFRKTKQRTLDEILGIQIQEKSEAISTQQQAFQLAGRELPKELQEGAIKLQFDALGIAFRKLGLDTTILTQLFQEALSNLADARNRAQLQVQAQAYQLAGRDVPMWIQQAGVRAQFADLRQQFEELGLDTTVLTELLQEALDNLSESNQEAAQLVAKRQGIIGAQQRAFQLAGREVPIELQRNALIIEFEALGESFRQLGLDTTILSQLLAEGLENLEETIQLARRQGIIGAQQRAFQLAGREVPMELQRIALIVEFEALGKAFRDLGLDTTVLTQLLAEGLQNLEEASVLARRQGIIGAQQRAFQLAGREVPMELQRTALIIEFEALSKAFKDLGLDTSVLTGLLSEGLANMETAARRSAIERAYQLAGEEIPKEVQIASVTADFAELGDLFRDLGLDSGILGDLLKKAIEKINKAGEDLNSGGFIGFIDEFGRITELDPRMRDIGSAVDAAANDSQFFGRVRSPIYDIGHTPEEGRMPVGSPIMPPNVVYPPTWNKGPDDLDLMRRTPRDLNELLRRPNPAGGGVEVNIIMNGPTVFDDISQAKFTRAVAKGLESRRARFG